MSLPDPTQLYEVVSQTWPALTSDAEGPWIIRTGDGGGSRVSAASATRDGLTPTDIAKAEAAMLARGQTPLFMIRAADTALDALLAEAGYRIKDPVNLYAAPIGHIATERTQSLSSFAVWPPLAIQQDIWAAGGIGPARLRVMDRAPHPKTTLLGRRDDKPAATLFVGIHDGCAMIHALEVAVAHRRHGMGEILTRAAAFWAQAHGARWLTLVTTCENTAANRLYTSLGMHCVGQYHYRAPAEGPAS